MSQVTEEQLEEMEGLFVQTAASMTSDGRTISLEGLSPSTLYFSDRQSARSGTCRRVNSWTYGETARTASLRPPERRPLLRGAGRQAPGGRRRRDPGPAPGWTACSATVSIFSTAPYRHHRAMCTFHRPFWPSVVTSLRRRYAPARAPPGPLRPPRPPKEACWGPIFSAPSLSTPTAVLHRG